MKTGAFIFLTYFFSSFSGGTRGCAGCAACAAHSASRFFRRFFAITTAAPPLAASSRTTGQNMTMPRMSARTESTRPRVPVFAAWRQLRAEAAALGGGGQSLHLIERDGKGREADQIVIMALGAGQRVDLIFTVRERVFERNDVLHFARLIEQGEPRRSCLVWSVASRVSMSVYCSVMSSLEREE